MIQDQSFFYYLKAIFPFIRPYVKWIIVSLIFTIIFAISNVYIMPLVNDIVREVTNKNLTYFNNHILNACILFFIRLSSQYTQEYIMEKVSSKVMMDIRIKAFKMIHYFPSDEYNTQKHGDLISRIMNDTEKIKITLYRNFESLIPNALTILGVCGYLFYINWELTALSLFGAPIFVLTLSYFTKRLRRVTKQIQQKTADITQMVQETLANIKIIQIYNNTEKNIEKFERLHIRYIHGYLKEIRFRITREQIDAYIQFSLFMFILWYGGTQVLNGQITSSGLLVFFTGIVLLIDPISRLSKVYSLTFQVTASIERILFIIQMPIQNDSGLEKMEINHFDSISFSNVTFRYPSTHEDVLQNVSFNIKSGDMIGIVGQSGSGKSTLVNLLTKFYTPNAGTNCFDDVD
ncbi:MAG: ABC transporter transmembrane domain-containing protein, partial [Candidatus Margulisiibacteriota bacterium]